MVCADMGHLMTMTKKIIFCFSKTKELVRSCHIPQKISLSLLCVHDARAQTLGPLLSASALPSLLTCYLELLHLSYLPLTTALACMSQSVCAQHLGCC